MNTVTSDPEQPGSPPGPRPAYPVCLPVHTVMRFLAAGGCEKISVTTGNSGHAVKAASDLLRGLGVFPDREEP